MIVDEGPALGGPNDNNPSASASSAVEVTSSFFAAGGSSQAHTTNIDFGNLSLILS